MQSDMLTPTTRMWCGHATCRCEASRKYLGVNIWKSKLHWAQWSHGGTTGMCLPLETTAVKMGCWIGRMPWENTDIRENCWIMVLRTVFPGHPGNSMPFNPFPTVTQSPFISPSQRLCWLCFLAPCPIPLVFPTCWICSRSGRCFFVLGTSFVLLLRPGWYWKT